MRNVKDSSEFKDWTMVLKIVDGQHSPIEVAQALEHQMAACGVVYQAVYGLAGAPGYIGSSFLATDHTARLVFMNALRRERSFAATTPRELLALSDVNGGAMVVVSVSAGVRRERLNRLLATLSDCGIDLCRFNQSAGSLDDKSLVVSLTSVPVAAPAAIETAKALASGELAGEYSIEQAVVLPSAWFVGNAATRFLAVTLVDRPAALLHALRQFEEQFADALSVHSASPSGESGACELIVQVNDCTDELDGWCQRLMEFEMIESAVVIGPQ